MADPRGSLGARPPRLKFFNLHAVFGKKLQNNTVVQCPLHWNGAPIGNPGSATGKGKENLSLPAFGGLNEIRKQ